MKYEYNLILRVILCFIPLQLFYIIFTPITVYSTYFLLKLYNPSLIGDTITIGSSQFDIVSACVAGFVYLLLLMLVLLTKNIKLLTRIKMILLGFLLLLVFNILRIDFLIFLTLNYGVEAFESVHMLFWNLFSGAFVAVIWIVLVSIFKIKDIPIYSDLKYLYKKSKK